MKRLNIYLVEGTDNTGYDSFVGYVIRAKSVRDAERFVQGDVWDASRVAYKITKVGVCSNNSEDIVILDAYNAG